MKLIEFDPVSGVSTWWAYDESTEETHIIRQQNTDAILRANRAMANSGGHKNNWSWHAARLPAIVIEKWRNELGIDVFNRNDWPAVRRLLNSNEWRWLRTAEFQI